jgi:hypothetical protein
MGLNSPTAHLEPAEGKYAQELQYLYRRLHSVENLIRTLEAYDLLRPKPIQIPITEKTA